MKKLTIEAENKKKEIIACLSDARLQLMEWLIDNLKNTNNADNSDNLCLEELLKKCKIEAK